jgi:DNA repair photolyase
LIISASRRTDIPAFYASWLLNRLRAGYVSSVNPYNRTQVRRISLKPEDVDVIVFWTKNPTPLLPYLDEIDQMGLRYYFHFTLNDYPRILEPGMPELEERIGTFQQLAARIGKERVIWRYDPVLFTAQTDSNYHRRRFAALFARLASSTGRIVVSIADAYRGAGQRLAKLADRGYAVIDHPQLEPEYARLFCEMADRAAGAGLAIYSCAEPFDLQPFGIQAGKCIDNDYIQQVFGITVTAKKDQAQRLECGCVVSRDIGSYDSCLHDCIYCYATRDQKTARQNYNTHREDSPSLLGWDEAPPVMGKPGK